MNALEVQGLEVAYGAVRALKGVSLSVGQGEVITLLGANGAGKSTTLRAISGLVRPRAGSITYRGEALTRLSPAQIVRRGIAHCPEGRRVFAGLSVHDNLLLGASGRRDPEIGLDIQRMFTLFPILAERRNQAAGTLSGGEQQMLALARALMSRPTLLLLDEPSLGLAPLVVRSIFATLKELKAAGITILLVEQNVKLALELADRAYVLRTGQVVLEGKAEELRDDARVARAYLGGAA
ncbi:ABC transporter ATP-binding protein [Meiothermus rufus]|uniref:ABC transporter ATP-binding protein n=1 Tax=Meiothermus rufus TaxID=604332 RepID=UPI0003F642A9|nr:ABC transporter ATP-binding protein [Meiothermus rufus]